MPNSINEAEASGVGKKPNKDQVAQIREAEREGDFSNCISEILESR